MIRTTIAAGLLLVLSGCATTDPTPPVPAQPLLTNYRAEAERVISTGLRDPASAQYEHRDAPYRLECDRGVFTPAKQEFWVVEVWVNARNGFGGYTGPQPYSVIFIPDSGGGTRMQANVGAGGGRMTAMSGICRRVAG